MIKEQKTLTVTQLNSFVKMLLDNNPVLEKVYVAGEISNISFAKSGHIYFSLKDAESSVKAVMFKREADGLRFIPENGMHVIVSGRVSSYVRDGNYQLYCTSMEPEGIGALYLAFEQLKAKLEAEGLFGESYKKPLPQIPMSVGIVTSPTGAAIKDILNISSRRFAAAEITVYPSLVQGKEAEQELVSGIEYFNKKGNVDVIILTRGGGSAEDLWVFNSEKLARAVFSSDIPVVSAVGHERDYTIADFVADKRAPTPSAAAEIVFPDALELRKNLVYYYTKMKQAVNNTVSSKRMQLNALASMRQLVSYKNVIDDKRIYIDRMSELLDLYFYRIFEEKKHELSLYSAAIDGHSPLGILARGYAIAYKNGEAVSSVDQLNLEDMVKIKLKDGTVGAVIKEKENG